MDSIFSYLFQQLPIAAIILVIVYAAVFITWKVAMWNTRLTKVENHVDNASCNTHSSDISELKKEQKTLTKDNNFITTWIMKVDPNTIQSFVKCSPTRILPHGFAILELSGAKKCVDENFSFFKSNINVCKPETEYDVESRAISTAVSSISESFMNPVKRFLYFAPEKMTIKAIIDSVEVNKDMNISELLISRLIGIYVRDKYLELFQDRDEHFYI